MDIRLDNTGNIYVSDANNNTIRKGTDFYRSWLNTHNLPTNGSADNVDSDGDGFTNLQEFYAGTDPNDPKSVLHVSGVMQDNGSGGFIISWPCVDGITYKVLYADDPGGPWMTNLPDSQITAGVGQTSLSYTDTTIGTVSKRFYRVKLVTP